MASRRELWGTLLTIVIVWMLLWSSLWQVSADEPVLRSAPAAVASPMQTQAASRGPEDLRLTGPAEVDLGQTITLSVEGLPAVDLSQTVGQQTAWIDALRFQLSAPIGADTETVKELSMGVSPWVWRLRVTFTPQAAGVYLLICDWNEPPYGLAVHRITVRDPRPPPVTPPLPPSDPTLPPLPSRPTAAVYVWEKDQRAVPLAVAAALQQINKDSSGIVATDFEKDTVTGSGTVPRQYQAAWTAAREAGIPCLVVLAGEQVLRVVRDPRTEAQVLEAVK